MLEDLLAPSSTSSINPNFGSIDLLTKSQSPIIDLRLTNSNSQSLADPMQALMQPSELPIVKTMSMTRATGISLSDVTANPNPGGDTSGDSLFNTPVKMADFTAIPLPDLTANLNPVGDAAMDPLFNNSVNMADSTGIFLADLTANPTNLLDNQFNFDGNSTIPTDSGTSSQKLINPLSSFTPNFLNNGISANFRYGNLKVNTIFDTSGKFRGVTIGIEKKIGDTSTASTPLIVDLGINNNGNSASAQFVNQDGQKSFNTFLKAVKAVSGGQVGFDANVGADSTNGPTGSIDVGVSGTQPLPNGQVSDPTAVIPDNTNGPNPIAPGDSGTQPLPNGQVSDPAAVIPDNTNGIKGDVTGNGPVGKVINFDPIVIKVDPISIPKNGNNGFGSFIDNGKVINDFAVG